MGGGGIKCIHIEGTPDLDSAGLSSRPGCSICKLHKDTYLTNGFFTSEMKEWARSWKACSSNFKDLRF